jgi:hypothetical protein
MTEYGADTLDPEVDDLERIDPDVTGIDVPQSTATTGRTAVLIVIVSVCMAVVVAGAVSVFFLTGSAWFGTAVEPFFVYFFGLTAGNG